MNDKGHSHTPFSGLQTPPDEHGVEQTVDETVRSLYCPFVDDPDGSCETSGTESNTTIREFDDERSAANVFCERTKDDALKEVLLEEDVELAVLLAKAAVMAVYEASPLYNDCEYEMIPVCSWTVSGRDIDELDEALTPARGSSVASDSVRAS